MSRLALRKQSCNGPQDQRDQSGDRNVIGKQPRSGPEDQDDHRSADSDVIGNCHGVALASLMHCKHSDYRVTRIHECGICLPKGLRVER
jgi:hypothetical protein